MNRYELFIKAMNRQVEVLTVENEGVKEKAQCPEISLAKTIKELLISVNSCFTAGGNAITSVVVIGMIVTKLGELAISMIRAGSVMNWLDFFKMLCAFIKSIIDTLLQIGVANQFLANPALVQILVQQIVGKLGFILGETFYSFNRSVFNSPQFNQFLSDLLMGGRSNTNAFCSTIAKMTEEEAATLVTVIMAEFEKVSSVLQAGSAVLSQGLASVDLRSALILAALAAVGITLYSGGTSAPITGPILAIIVAGFILLGQEPPTKEELRSMGFEI